MDLAKAAIGRIGPDTGLDVDIESEAPARRFGFDLTEAFIVGDYARDVGLGRAVGATTFLVLTGHGAGERVTVERDGLADHIVRDLVDAAGLTAERMGKTRDGSEHGGHWRLPAAICARPRTLSAASRSRTSITSSLPLHSW